jgi:YidC/Oxa1 family membrane protein insertase
MPVLFGLYSVIVNPLKYISGMASEVVTKLTTIFNATNYDIDVIRAVTNMGAAIDPVVKSQITDSDLALIDNLRKSFTVFGIDLSVEPTMGLNIYIIIPILTFIFAFFSTKIIRKFTYQPEQNADMQRSMGMMDWSMPLLSVWISFSVPAAIAIYWIIQNILSAVQQVLLHKMYPIPAVSEEQIKEAELQLKGKSLKNKQNGQSSRSIPEPDYHSPIYEEVPDVDFKDNDNEELAVKGRPVGLTPAIKKHLKETGKPLKARRRI